MIKDSITRAETYYGISENLRKGFEWIKNNDFKKLSDGRHEISENIYANIQSYETKEDAPYEAHRDYIDIQYMIEGEENTGVTDYSNCSVKESYNKEKDIEFLHFNTDEKFYTIKEGEFFVFFPHDAHKPALKTDKNRFVRKVIVKVGV